MPERLKGFTTRRYVSPRYLYLYFYCKEHHAALSHFTFWIGLSLSPNTTYTHKPQGLNYLGYLHVLKYLLLLLLPIILNQKGEMQTSRLVDVKLR